ncbi:hypothetical protein [Cryobacterium sp. Y11]|uniref:hypothetical protein n=1 Tax=Cryobacterium sp. Y11 TaxID=2045016 RepID=UPI0011AFE72B|nr:hypothetical protein [Cryobacterium sp. Y11]
MVFGLSRETDATVKRSSARAGKDLTKKRRGERLTYKQNSWTGGTSVVGFDGWLMGNKDGVGRVDAQVEVIEGRIHRRGE